MRALLSVLVLTATAACGGGAGAPAAQATTAPATTAPATAAPTTAAPTVVAKPPANPVAIPKDKDTDLRLFYANGTLVKGTPALEKMATDAELILWLAGNQFFAMEDVVKAFQKQQPTLDVAVITLPPGLLLKGIQGGGVTYEGKSYGIVPDIYSSVDLPHLQTLKKEGKMEQYAIHMHNELQIMVAPGNPKGIKTMRDLVRPDVKTSNPNPLTEGIMSSYAKKVLVRLGIYDQISGGKECESCQTTPNNWFTSVHHRETPDRIKAGQSDAGIVWKTEVLEALRDGAKIEGVELPLDESLRNEVSYAIGPLKIAPHPQNAILYMDFLKTPEAQAAYGKFGFVNATADELKLKPIP